MRDISIGIYHKDYQYGKRLMEYLNHQKDFPMTASFISDEDAFFRQEEEGDFECLVLAEETDYHGSSPVCRIGVNDSMGGMYCQSGKEIAAGIYHCLNVSPQLDDEKIFGVYLKDKSTAFGNPDYRSEPLDKKMDRQRCVKHE